MLSPTRLSIPLPSSLLSAVALWALALLLMTIATVSGRVVLLGMWSLIAAIGAATCSVAHIAGAAQKVILDVVSWEHKRTRGDDVGPPPVRGPDDVVPMARRGRDQR